MNIYKSIIKKLYKANSVCLISHIHPDVDAIASMTVFKTFLIKKLKVKQVDIFADTDELSNVLQEVIYPHNINPTPSEYDFAIMMDSPNIPRLGKYSTIFTSAKNKIIIDHHEPDTVDCQYKIIETLSSCCELVFKILYAYKFNFTKEIMGKLYAGMITDTNNFSVGAYNSDTLKIAGALLKQIDYHAITKYCFLNNSLNSLKAKAIAINNILALNNNQIIISFIDKETADKNNLTEFDFLGIVKELNSIDTAKLVAFIKPDKDKYYISLRAVPGLDVVKIAKKYNGGGHKGASGILSDLPLDDIIKTITEELQNELQNYKTSEKFSF